MTQYGIEDYADISNVSMLEIISDAPRLELCQDIQEKFLAKGISVDCPIEELAEKIQLSAIRLLKVHS